MKDKNELIIWEDQIYKKSRSVNIFEKKMLKELLNNKSYILIGNSTRYDKYKSELNSIIEREVLEYENSHTILFERV